MNNSNRADQNPQRPSSPQKPGREERHGNNRHRRNRNREGGNRESGNRDAGNPARNPTSQPDNRPARRPRVSVVIPLYNEAESLRELGERLEATLTKMTGGSYEVIFVDDGSRDNSYEVIRELHRNNPRFSAVRFRTNFGKSAALAVGFESGR